MSVPTPRADPLDRPDEWNHHVAANADREPINDEELTDTELIEYAASFRSAATSSQPTPEAAGLREALNRFAAGGVTRRLDEYATNPDDPLHADIQELLTAFRAALAATMPEEPSDD